MKNKQLTLLAALFAGIILALSGCGGTSDADVRRIEGNLRQYDSAARQYLLETGRPTAGYSDLVGEGKYLLSLRPVRGEDYASLAVSADTASLRVTTSDGREVVWSRRP